MGQVIDLEAYRKRRKEAGEATSLRRLELAVARLEPLVSRRRGRLGPTVERELEAITVAVSQGQVDRAAHRAERLLGMLTHPLASG